MPRPMIESHDEWSTTGGESDYRTTHTDQWNEASTMPVSSAAGHRPVGISRNDLLLILTILNLVLVVLNIWISANTGERE